MDIFPIRSRLCHWMPGASPVAPAPSYLLNEVTGSFDSIRDVLRSTFFNNAVDLILIRRLVINQSIPPFPLKQNVTHAKQR